jgi:hypothetical protein
VKTVWQSKGDRKSQTVLQYLLCELPSLHNPGPLNNHPLLGIALIVGALPIAWATPDHPQKKQKERSHHQQGAEVGKRVRDLRKYNSRLQAALSAFEKRANPGHSPKIDEAESITVDSDSDNENQSGALKLSNSPSPFQKVCFKPQTPDYSLYGYEMIFIPTIAIPVS